MPFEIAAAEGFLSKIDMNTSYVPVRSNGDFPETFSVVSDMHVVKIARILHFLPFYARTSIKRRQRL